MREEGWAPEEGWQQVLEGLRRGDSGNWRGCGGMSLLVCSVCTVVLLVEPDWSKPRL